MNVFHSHTHTHTHSKKLARFTVPWYRANKSSPMLWSERAKSKGREGKQTSRFEHFIWASGSFCQQQLQPARPTLIHTYTYTHTCTVEEQKNPFISKYIRKWLQGHAPLANAATPIVGRPTRKSHTARPVPIYKAVEQTHVGHESHNEC